MPDDIERIVDRKLIKQRVHYLVVWKGFEQENNTWESRIDLMADGYSDVIKDYEDQRKQELQNSTPRGRSPSRLRSKSPRRSKSPGRTRGRRSRSRSVSVNRKVRANDDEKENKASEREENSSKITDTRQRTSPRNIDKSDGLDGKSSLRHRSSRIQASTETSSSTQFVSRLDDEDDSVITRSTMVALTPQVRELAYSSMEINNKKPMTLMYEEDEDSDVSYKQQDAKKNAKRENSNASSYHYKHENSEPSGLVARVVNSGHLASFLSTAAVVGSLMASQLLPHEAEEEMDIWRSWLSFVIPVVALLLFFHQKDARSSAKWIATGLAWRAAAELLLLIGVTPRQFEMMIAISVILANVSLLNALVSILRNGKHEHNNSALALVTVGITSLFISDSLVIISGNSELQSRVILMSMAVLTIALSPIPTMSSEDDN
ncbi:hypothetical protein CCR75_005835 [Bremia lactucae]|uniref:Chromo domain-containing protein n=1 Tax=Bremia lactucae TaxID=4779 RepID=A0A976FKZ2_BRELC|nr:hypothetical protein CCR75_005835 [Bremia lactucae]